MKHSRYAFSILVLLLALSLSMLGRAQGFGGKQVIIEGIEHDKPKDVYSADLDGDGDMDVISTSERDDKIAWYENLGGGSFETQQVITTDADGVESVQVTDLDGDGDADILFASKSDDRIAWYENQGGSFGGQQVITTDADAAVSVYAADLDGDGDADVLSTSSSFAFGGKIVWYENDGNVSFGSQQDISTDAYGPESVYVADLDGDGYPDVLSASCVDNKIAWHENQGGSFSEQKIVSDEAHGVNLVWTTDLDGDGDVDVLYNTSTCSWGSGGEIGGWYENQGGGSFSDKKVIISNGYRFHAADLDGDGDADILFASKSDNRIAWYENQGGSFSDKKVISNQYAIAVYAADLDGDGDADVLSVSKHGEVAWHKNLFND